ncbi:right-handed parallel beta-helix repeat-containing protein [Methylibium sp.]|uniref:right-handed parallel beta-helix repeat-containing protein n=1 Tax=Methylibium sp. TaxID=2067992 RepID=UPI003D0CDBB9
MRSVSINLKIIAAAVIASALLSACGGGSSGAADSTAGQLSGNAATSSVDSADSSQALDAQATTGARTASIASVSTTPSWTSCATEGGTCSFSGTRSVRYGSSTLYVIKTFSSSVLCANNVFGDPAFGVTKSCWYDSSDTTTTTAATTTTATTTSSSTESWLQCAKEGQQCTFSGTLAVRYGTSTQYVTKTMTGPVNCSNTVFGDPAFGVAKACWYATQVLTTATVSLAPATATTTTTTATTSTTTSGGIPTPASIAGKPVVGAITATSGMVIEGKHITNPNGPCIFIPQGVTNVIIRDNEIGPCGKAGDSVNRESVYIDAGASNVTIQRNWMHDMSTGIYARQAKHPLVIEKNFVSNIRGPLWQGQFVQLASVREGSGQTRITCNVLDGRYGTAPSGRSNEDHISLYNTLGSQSNPIEIAYNRIRGYPMGGGRSGSGMQLGDGGTSSTGSGWYWVHDNTIVYTNGSGISVAGGSNITIENNRVDNRGPNQDSMTSQAFVLQAHAPINGVTLRNNRGIANGWAWDGGRLLPGFYTDNLAINVSLAGNTWGDTSLGASLFDQQYSQCQ